jgi:hypothetical protein
MHQNLSHEANIPTRGKRKIMWKGKHNLRMKRKYHLQREEISTETMDTPKYFNLCKQHLCLITESMLEKKLKYAR